MTIDALKLASEHYHNTAHKHGWGDWRYVRISRGAVTIRTEHMRDGRRAEACGRDTVDAITRLARVISEEP